MTKLSHIEINVSDYSKSIRFYDMILIPLGWKRLVCTLDCTTYSDGVMKFIISSTDSKFSSFGFHRKRVGLNHLAFSALSSDIINNYHKNVLQKNSIECLYEKGPRGDKDYYAVYFEDPDRIKIEVVFSPEYCIDHHWTNQFENNFDPYKTIPEFIKIDDTLVLKAVTQNDAEEFLIAIKNNRSFFDTFDWNLPKFETLDEVKNAIATLTKYKSDYRGVSYGLWKNDSKLLGLVTVNSIDWSKKSMDAGYWLIKSETNNGYARKSILKLIETFSADLNICEMTATTAITNIRSQNLLTKIGFCEHSRSIGSLKVDEKRIDQITYLFRKA
ncbi:MAG: GNAT family N-acetyltransferase [Pseudobdellovibrio sp.]